MAEPNVIPNEPILGNEPPKPDTPPVKPAQPAGEPKPDTILTAPVSIMNPDGTFIENWRQHSLIPEELRKDTSLEVIKTFPDLVKRTVNAVKMVGKDKVVVPTDKSKPEEWDSFYTSIGRPPKSEGYKVPEIPEDLQEIFSKDVLTQDCKIAFEIGATQKQFEAFEKYQIEKARQLLAEEDNRELQEKQNTEKALRTEFGAAYDERIHVANRLIAEAFPNEEERMNFLEKYCNDPDFIRFASRVGSRMSEHTALIAELTQKTPNEALARIAQLRATPGYMTMDGKLTKEQIQAITDEIRELTKQTIPAKAG